MKTVNVILTQYTDEIPSGAVIADGVGEWDEKILRYHEKEETSVLNEILFCDGGIEMIRYADIKSHTKLPENGLGESLIYSPWGNMVLQTRLNYLEMQENRLTVDYDILQNDMPVTSQKLVWTWEEIHE